MVLPSAGDTVPVARGLPLGSPPGVAFPRPVTKNASTSPALAGWPQAETGLTPFDVQLVRKPSAAAWDVGMILQAVPASRTAAFCRVGLEGSGMRRIPGVADAMVNMKFALAPTDVFTCT